MAPATDPGEAGRWPVWKLALLLYPFAAPAVAINLFMIALICQWVGLPALAPGAAFAASAVLGLPAAWLAGRWVRALLDQAAA